ncbi:MAG TPA: flagellar motor protein MotB [Burkholderiaceae bacterium]|jgi:chemotaxis protein MotB|nr:flagellar motor protein MotB [Burkholderiaceae bacterium]
MATTSSEKAKSTIVIKRIKKYGHASHGAAWKIAYADFVTAMMAFFLLMWLLGSTTKGDLKGIAEYFQTPLQVALAGGSGSGDATSIISGGGEDLTRVVGQRKRGEQENRRKSADRQQHERRRVEQLARMEELKARIDGAILANATLSEFRNQIRVEITPDGLRIQIVDDFKRPMFDLGGATVKSYMREILREIGKVLNDVDNKIALTGHTDSAPYSGGQRSYSNWELSADRANASRRELIAGGMDPQKIARVVGLADSSLLDKDDPRNPLNRRISIIVLNKIAEERLARARGEIEAGDPEEVTESLPQGTGPAAATPAPVPSGAAPDASPSPAPQAGAQPVGPSPQ